MKLMPALFTSTSARPHASYVARTKLFDCGFVGHVADVGQRFPTARLDGAKCFPGPTQVVQRDAVSALGQNLGDSSPNPLGRPGDGRNWLFVFHRLSRVERAVYDAAAR